MAWAVSPRIRVTTAVLAAVALSAVSLSVPLFFMSPPHPAGPPSHRHPLHPRAAAGPAGGAGDCGPAVKAAAAGTVVEAQRRVAGLVRVNPTLRPKL